VPSAYSGDLSPVPVMHSFFRKYLLRDHGAHTALQDVMQKYMLNSYLRGAIILK
jgi:hypothetical protein